MSSNKKYISYQLAHAKALALLGNSFKLKTDLQKTAYPDDLKIASASHFFPQLFKTAKHLSEVSPIITAKEKLKHNKSSGGLPRLRRVENEVDSFFFFFFPVSSLAQNGSSAASISSRPGLCKSRSTDKWYRAGFWVAVSLSAPGAIKHRHNLAHPMNQRQNSSELLEKTFPDQN